VFLKKIPAHTLAHTLDCSVFFDQRLIFRQFLSGAVLAPTLN